MDNKEYKQEKAVEFIKALEALEQQMEPLKQAKRDLRADFQSQGWLTNDEIWSVIRAWRMIQKNIDMSEFDSIHDALDKYHKLISGIE